MGRLSVGLSTGRIARACTLAAAALALAHCSSPWKESRYSPRVIEDGDIPKGGGRYSVGRPYSINGKTYYPREEPNYSAEGVASWYGPDFHGRLTSNGEIYNMHGISAAHTTLPLPSYARVTNLANGKSIIVRVNDRGPFVRNRIIDLSIGTAKALEFYGHGLAQVRVEYVGRAPIEGSDDRMLLATLRSGTPAPAPSQVMVASATPFIGAGKEKEEASRGMPLPAERPYALGSPSARGNAATADATPPGRAPARSVVRAREDADTSPVTMASPSAAPREGALGLMSGRGLY
jgi:rare lipoprotein A